MNPPLLQRGSASEQKQGPGLLPLPPKGTSSTSNAEPCECKGFVALAALSSLGTTLLKQGEEISFRLKQTGLP